MVRIGICSWAEKSLVQSGGFYPKGMKKAEDRLRFYAENFDTVEVDSTYYAIANIENAFLWAERTPPGFIFHIKAYGALTGHNIRPETLPKNIFRSLPEEDKTKSLITIKEAELFEAIAKQFTESITPLAQAKKLGLLIFQFPQSFRYSEENLERLGFLRKLVPDFALGIEFRHGSWLTLERRKEVFGFLEENGLTYITADEPQYGTLATVPFVPYATSDTACFRLHGRNKKNWLQKNIETSLRYDYLYSEEELRELAAPALELGKKKTVYFMLNNCRGSNSVRNAETVKKIVAEVS